MNLKHLRHFFTVVDKGSFSEAAVHLYVSQPAVSKSIHELEAYFELALIERAGKGRPLRLTDEGRVLFDYARSIFGLVQAASTEITARKNLSRGILTLGLSPTIANYWMPGYLKRYIEIYPDIDLKVVVESSHALCRLLQNHQLDLALVEGQDIDGSLFEQQAWAQDELILVSKQNDALFFDTWLMRESGSMTREMTNSYLKKLGIKPARVIEVSSNEAIVRMLRSGLGVAILPYVLVEEWIQSGDLAQVIMPTEMRLSRELKCLRCHHRPISPAALAFQQLIFAGHESFN